MNRVTTMLNSGDIEKLAEGAYRVGDLEDAGVRLQFELADIVLGVAGGRLVAYYGRDLWQDVESGWAPPGDYRVMAFHVDEGAARELLLVALVLSKGHHDVSFL